MQHASKIRLPLDYVLQYQDIYIYIYMDKSECNTSARFTFPLIMFFNTSSIHMDESECNMSARFAFGYLIIFFFWTIPIYIHTCTMYPSFRLYILGTYNTGPDTTTTTSVVAVLLLALLQAASPWPASSSDSIFQTKTVFCLKNKSFAFWNCIVHSSSSLRLIFLTI